MNDQKSSMRASKKAFIVVLATLSDKPADVGDDIHVVVDNSEKCGTITRADNDGIVGRGDVDAGG